MKGEIREFRTGWLQWRVICLEDDDWGGKWKIEVRSFKVTGELASEEWKVLKDRYGKIFNCESWHKVMEACLAEERWRHPGWRNEWEYAHMMAKPSRGYEPPPGKKLQGSWSQRCEAGLEIDDTDSYDVSDQPF